MRLPHIQRPTLLWTKPWPLAMLENADYPQAAKEAPYRSEQRRSTRIQCDHGVVQRPYALRVATPIPSWMSRRGRMVSAVGVSAEDTIAPRLRLLNDAVDHESLVLAYHMSGVGQVERSPRATGLSPPDPTAVMAADANHRAATVDLQRGQAPRLHRQTGTMSPCQPAGKDPR
jgi:hypothetical protein